MTRYKSRHAAPRSSKRATRKAAPESMRAPNDAHPYPGARSPQGRIHPSQADAYAAQMQNGAPQQPRETQTSTKRAKRGGCGCALGIAFVVLLIAILAAGAILLVKPDFAQPVLTGVFGVTDKQAAAPAQDEPPAYLSMEVQDREVTEAAKEAERKGQMHQRRLLAQCQGVDIYCPISQDELTGVIMHQASSDWAQVMSTQVPEADIAAYEESGEALRVNNEQTEGEWVDADMGHIYRDGETTAMDTSLDVGAAAGTTVYAPVTGEVIAVEDYDLYGETPDVRIHIRPDANPDLDVVLLHQSNPAVKAGDRVVAGVTPISLVRDIASHLTDIQLAFYAHTDGNHSHVQVNDLKNQDYVARYNLPV